MFDETSGQPTFNGHPEETPAASSRGRSRLPNATPNARSGRSLYRLGDNQQAIRRRAEISDRPACRECQRRFRFLEQRRCVARDNPPLNDHPLDRTATRLRSNPRANTELTKASEVPVMMRRYDRVPGLARQNASGKMAGPTIQLHRPDTLRYDLIELDRGETSAPPAPRAESPDPTPRTRAAEQRTSRHR